MRITYYGQSLFRLTFQPKKEEVVNIVINPFLKLAADILLLSQPNGKDILKTISGNSFLIDGPGEYDVKQIFIQGISSKDKQEKENIIYTIEAWGLKISYLGFLGQKELTPQQIEKINDIDILIIFVDKDKTISASEAKKIISQLGPKIVIPMSFQSTGQKNDFLKTIGAKSTESQDKLIIKKKDLPQDMEIVILKP